MKMVIIIFVVVLITGGVAWWFLKGDDDGMVYVEENKETGEVEVFNLIPHFVDFKPLVVPIIYKGKLIGNIGIIVSLEVRNEKNELLVIDKKISIRNAFLRDMRLATRNFDGSQMLDLTEIKIRFQKSCDRI